MKEKSARWVKCEIDIQKLYICVPEEEGPARPPAARPHVLPARSAPGCAGRGDIFGTPPPGTLSLRKVDFL